MKGRATTFQFRKPFVDDTDLANTLKDGNDDIEELVSNAQKALDHWIGGLRALGVDMNSSKNYWYPIDFKMNAKGEWKYKKISQCSGSLCL